MALLPRHLLLRSAQHPSATADKRVEELAATVGQVTETGTEALGSSQLEAGEAEGGSTVILGIRGTPQSAVTRLPRRSLLNLPLSKLAAFDVI